MLSNDKVDPTDDIHDPAVVFDFPFTTDTESVEFLNSHGRIFFVIRGLPGSRKKVLGELLTELYDDSKIFWADKGFVGPMAGPRTKKAVGELHRACYTKIEKFMQDSVPVIINRNTNVTTAEVTRYIRLALQYGYTIILADTSRKVSSMPEVLQHTNTKRLGQRYLTERKAQWDEIYPLYTGWFLRPSDGFYLQKRYAEISSVLAKSGWNTPKILHAECITFCLGRFCFFGKAPEDQAYCDSDKVKDGYGMKHTLTVFGFVVVDNIALAAVKLSKGQQSMIDNADDENQCSAGRTAGRQLDSWEPTACSVKIAVVISVTTDQGEPIKLEKLEQVPKADEVSFIVLGRTESQDTRNFAYGKELHDTLKKFSEERMREEGLLSGEKLSVDQIDAYKVEEDFLIVDNKTISLDSVFTGFYQVYSLLTPVCRFFFSPGGCNHGPACRFRHVIP